MSKKEGLYPKYEIRKITGIKNVGENFLGELEGEYETKPVDPKNEYFVLKVGGEGDANHIEACRKAVLTYAEEIKDHLPKLSKDLIDRYSTPKNS